jgi:SAM-dependent methyltransferase
MTEQLTTRLAVPPPQTALWEMFYRRWRRMVPPLRPGPEVCTRIRALIEANHGRALVLGATPELTALANETVAIDWSESALRHIWPGRAPGRVAVRADWLHLPCADRSFFVVVGDGSLNCLEYPAGYRNAFNALARVVRPGGRIVMRVFVSPERAEPLSAARAAALAGTVRAVGALKWRIAHVIAAEQGDPNVSTQSIAEAFNQCFPDRRALVCATGWSHEDLEEVDLLTHAPGRVSFPTASQLLQVVPPSLGRASLRVSGTYELAERCPLLVVDVAS